ncbi:MAG TPA: thiamine diphosphokinase [Chitinispirillaceae bacterium]|nr:thiamine diphosphokinase [Chitinispirillaceae bacterium]
MNACIFANGEIDSGFPLSSYCNGTIKCELVIAADGGVSNCLSLGIKPDLIVGDMDSIDSTSDLLTNGIERITYPTKKDKTDTECAVDIAFQRKCEQVTIIGGMGKRFDHTLGNISLLAKYPGRIGMATPGGLIIALGQNHKCSFEGPLGAIVSIIVWGSEACVVSSGLEYQLNGKPVFTGTKGISNRIVKSPASLYVNFGTIILYIEKNISVSHDANRKKLQVPVQ